MTVCKFFLEGRCRYGSRCRNEHVLAGSGQSSGAAASAFGTTGTFKKQYRSINDFRTTDSIVRSDFSPAPQWPFTTYGPEPSMPSIIVDVDISPEELRANAYEMLASNQLNTHERLVNEMLQKSQKKQDWVRNHPFQALKTLLQVINNKSQPDPLAAAIEPASMFSSGPKNNRQQSSSFNPSAGSDFGSIQNSNPAFGQGSVFGSGQNTNSAFGFGQNTNSAFGSGQNANSSFGSGSAFGSGPSPGSAFGSTQPANSTFGSEPAFGSIQNSESAFGPGTGSAFASGSRTGSAFGSGVGSTFGTEPSLGTAFGSGNWPALGSGTVFGSNNEPTFGSGNGQTFGSGTGSAPFASAAPQQTSAFSFGGSRNTAFGQQQQQGDFGFPKPQTAANQVQSILDEFIAKTGGQPMSGTEDRQKVPYEYNDSISEEDRNRFLAERFEIGSIPEEPPPPDLVRR